MMHTHRLRPLGIALVLALALAPFLFGGWTPRWHVPIEDVAVSYSGLLPVLASGVVPLILLALCAAALDAGPRGLRDGLAFLCGAPRAGQDLAAHRALASAARATLGAGLLFGLVGLLRLFQVYAGAQLEGDHASPADLAEALQLILLIPLVALALGRLVLAPAAAAAAARAGAPERASLSGGAELAVFALLVPAVVAFLSIFYPLPL
jgi:hypothetical protein